MFRKTMVAGWGDMDFNSHMRNTAYLDRSADIRLQFFAEHGFPGSRFAELALGPVVRRDEIEYFREVGLLESFEVQLELCGQSEDGSRFHLRNRFFRHDGTPSATVTSVGGWLDIRARKLIAPPAALLAAMNRMPRTKDFIVLPSSLKAAPR
ncbi:MAG: thioesterase family protein [Lysobacteraceae bacterium]